MYFILVSCHNIFKYKFYVYIKQIIFILGKKYKKFNLKNFLYKIIKT